MIAVVPGAFDGHSVVVFTRTSNANAAIQLGVLREKPIHDQLTILVSKSLYEWAIDIAVRHEQPKEIVADIYRSYGDSYFQKGELDKAMSVYIRSVEENIPLETSYVVNKYFGDCRKINVNHIAMYLEAVIGATPAKTQNLLPLLILCYQSMNDSSTKLSSTLSKLSSSMLVELIYEIPKLVDALNVPELIKIANTNDGKRFFELLIDLQQDEKLDMILSHHELDPVHLARVVKESTRVSDYIITETSMGGLKDMHLESETASSIHVEYCRSPSTLALNYGEILGTISDDNSVSRKTLNLLLETSLRTKSNCKEIVRIMISRGFTIDAMRICKLFGAPASIILQLAAAMNSPYEALAYPAIDFGEVCRSIPTSQDMTLNAMAIQKRLGTKMTSVIDTGSYKSVAILLDSIDADHTNFGDIKGRLVDEFRAIEEAVTEGSNRSRNDIIECERMKSEISILRKKPIVHQFGRPCAACKNPITDLPATFFKCMHGYHQHCIGEGSICQVCSVESRHHMSILNQRRDAVGRPDELFKCMAGSNGKRFEVAMAYLGHGLFAQ
jgi:hypothetical protein